MSQQGGSSWRERIRILSMRSGTLISAEEASILCVCVCACVRACVCVRVCACVPIRQLDNAHLTLLGTSERTNGSSPYTAVSGCSTTLIVSGESAGRAGAVGAYTLSSKSAGT